MRFRSVAVAASCLLSFSACNDDGRTLDPAPEVPVSQETTTTTAGVTADSGDSGDSGD